MPTAPRKPCSTVGCPETIPPNTGSKCPEHKAQADKHRGTSTERGYKHRGHQHFKDAVLARDPICVRCMRARATEADHHPRSRRQLIALGLNADDPRYGRGLCHVCHSKETAQHQPGGWNAPQ